MRILDRGFDNWRQPVGQTMDAVSGLPAGRAQRVHPSLTAIFKMRARTKVRAFFVYIFPKGRDESPRPRVRQLATAVGQSKSAANRLPVGRAKRVHPSRCLMRHRAVWAPHPKPLPKGEGTKRHQASLLHHPRIFLSQKIHQRSHRR